MPLPSKTERPKEAPIAHPKAGAVIIPFPGSEARPVRPVPAPGETRGEIVLFLGVRYERLAS